ncbi:MAG TPA: hypothetical protein VK745_15480, partial [Polyangiaceae bacterium]|nr:hypothetical protein [Polyangiaceae bacterium]
MADARRWARSSLSIVRLVTLCAALVAAARHAFAQETEWDPKPAPPPPYSAWLGQTPVAPPSPIVLRAPPPPELAPLEYARRPFEIAPEFLLGFPSCSDGNVSNTRCAGLGAGAGLGLSALWRVSPYFALGATLNALGFAFNPPDSSHLSESRAGGLFYGLLGRVYFADHGPVEPYVELGLGGGADRTSAREANDVKYSDTASGVAFRAGGAIEFYVSRQLRLGPALDWTRFRVRQLQRCDPTQACVDLDSNSYGHGVGFTTLSVR